MNAFLLAAGKGLRLRPYTENIPKCLIKVKKKPLLDYWLNELDKINISKIFINTHYKSEMVHSYVRKHKSFNKIKILNEKKLLGTAGSLFKNVKQFQEDNMLMIHADNYSKFNISNLINAHNSRPKECLMTMMVFNSPSPKTCGIVEIDKNKIVKSFVEKPKKPLSNLANCAVYVLSKKFFKEFKQNDNLYDFSHDILPKLIGRIFTFKINENFFDIGHIKTYNLIK